MATIRQKIRDDSWLRQAFLIPSKDGVAFSDDIDRRNSTFTQARFSFGNTALGGSLAINPPPQYTPNADRRVPGLGTPANENGEPKIVRNEGSYGRYYYEAITETSRIVSMRFGVPEFNSLNSFFTGFYNSNAGMLARTGRGGGLLYNVGLAVGYVVPLFVWPLMMLNLAGDLYKYFLGRPRSKYYYMKPTMPLYWNAVTSMVNMLAVNKGVLPRIMDDNMKQILDDRFPFTADQVGEIAKQMPDIMMENGQINVYAMATKYQRLARRMYNYIQQRYVNADQFTDLNAMMDDLYKNGANLDPGRKSPSMLTYITRWFKSVSGTPKTTGNGSNNQPNAPTSGQTSANTANSTSTAAANNGDISASADTETAPKDRTDVDGFLEFLAAELDDGATFVSFRVDNEGPVSESFSSNTVESEIGNKINSMSGSSRETNFNLAGGNLSDGPIGTVIGGVMKGVKDILAGVGDALSISGIAALGGAAFVDIPKHWQSSTANLPRMNYSFTLISPYGNKMSQFMHIYVPLCMILAAALPLSTGRQSYTSPFLVQLFDRGRAQTRLGIIDSLSISRGTSHLGFNKSGNAMAIDVSFSVQDLSTVMHMPIIQGFSPLTSIVQGIFDDDTTFSDYMAVLGSLTVNEQIYPTDKLRLRLTRNMANMRSWLSPAHFAQWLGDLAPMQLISAFYPGRVNR